MFRVQNVCSAGSEKNTRRTDILEFIEKLVEFEKYCPKCKHWKKKEDEAPCRDCVSVAARAFSHKPEKFEAKKKG